jgi:hypothetical protein
MRKWMSFLISLLFLSGVTSIVYKAAQPVASSSQAPLNTGLLLLTGLVAGICLWRRIGSSR